MDPMERYLTDPNSPYPSLEVLAVEPTALFEQYEPINDAGTPTYTEDACENLYVVPY